MEAILILAAVLLVVLCLVLPIVAIVRTSRIRHLELRLQGVEAALLRVIEQQSAAPAPAPGAAEPVAVVPPVTEPVLAEPPRAAPPPPRPVVPPRTAQSVETLIGQKWLGWIAMVLIFVAAGFFLKYAFENRWIGELGRITLGVIGGLAFVWSGLDRYRKGWRYLSQILTAGGVTILYLSVYAAFGYYHLVNQRAAFAFLVVLVAEAQLLAVLYNARAISVMALAGGFLAPILLSTGRDQYWILFTYIVVLDLGMLAVVMAKRWRWLGSLAYCGTQVLFWAWYEEHYHPEKRAAVLLFQGAVFLLFLLADLAPHFRRRSAGWEEWIRLAVNPFVFFATCYGLLNSDHHDWMAVLALGLGIVYAGLAKTELALRPGDRRMLLVTVGTALTFATLAIPIQLESNWITIGWAIEAALLFWASFEAAEPLLRGLSALVYTLAVTALLAHDTPWAYRAPFTPIFNRYYLSVLAVSICLWAAARFDRRPASGARLALAMTGVAVLWLGSSIEAYSYFDAQAGRASAMTPADQYAAARQLRWAGQLALSVLWSGFAGLMTAAGFRLRQGAWRIAGLVLFGMTLLKVVFFDMAELQQFYRILALLALGVVLLVVAWAYQRVMHREQAR